MDNKIKVAQIIAKADDIEVVLGDLWIEEVVVTGTKVSTLCIYQDMIYTVEYGDGFSRIIQRQEIY